MSEETKVKRTRKSSNYVLQKILNKDDGILFGDSNIIENEDSDITWKDIRDGFISPEKALEFAEENQIEGQLRVIRVITPIFGGEIVSKYVLNKADKKGVRKTRKKKSDCVEQSTDDDLLNLVEKTSCSKIEVDPIASASESVNQ